MESNMGILKISAAILGLALWYDKPLFWIVIIGFVIYSFWKANSTEKKNKLKDIKNVFHDIEVIGSRRKELYINNGLESDISEMFYKDVYSHIISMLAEDVIIFTAALNSNDDELYIFWDKQAETVYDKNSYSFDKQILFY